MWRLTAACRLASFLLNPRARRVNRRINVRMVRLFLSTWLVHIVRSSCSRKYGTTNWTGKMQLIEREHLVKLHGIAPTTYVDKAESFGGAFATFLDQRGRLCRPVSSTNSPHKLHEIASDASPRRLPRPKFRWCQLKTPVVSNSRLRPTFKSDEPPRRRNRRRMSSGARCSITAGSTTLDHAPTARRHDSYLAATLLRDIDTRGRPRNTSKCWPPDRCFGGSR